MALLRHWLAATALTCGAVLGPAPSALATPLPLDGPWIVLDQGGGQKPPMVAGDFFKAPDGGIVWTLSCASACTFLITDLFVVTDRFEVYDGGKLIATTPEMPDWFAIGASDPFVSPPWTDSPDVAFKSGDFSALAILLAAGTHDLSIRDIHIPPVAVGGPAFPDGTVAFKAVTGSLSIAAVPEPATLVLFGIALVGLAFARRKKA